MPARSSAPQITMPDTSADARTIEVEIWSDVVCPWCLVGKRRFEAALARFPHRDRVQVRWRSFELNPNAPPRHSGTLDELLAHKYGRTLEQSAAQHEQLARVGAAEGIEFRFDLAKSGNTFDAHRLIQLGLARGVQDAVKERLMRAYFAEGVAIGESRGLIPIVAEAGLDPDEARQVLAGDAFADEVRADEALAQEIGINAVPFFVLADRYGISGAQPADLHLRALERVWSETQPLTLLENASSDAAACADESCQI